MRWASWPGPPRARRIPRARTGSRRSRLRLVSVTLASRQDGPSARELAANVSLGTGAGADCSSSSKSNRFTSLWTTAGTGEGFGAGAGALVR